MEEWSSLLQNLIQIHCSTGSVILNAMVTQYPCSLTSIYCPGWLVQWSHHCSCVCIPVYCPWLPGYVNVTQTILIILTMAGFFPARPRHILFCLTQMRLHNKYNIEIAFFFFNSLASVAQLVGASSHKPKVCRFDSHSGHMPGLQVQSQSGCMWEATNQCFSHTSMSLSLSLLLFPSL